MASAVGLAPATISAVGLPSTTIAAVGLASTIISAVGLAAETAAVGDPPVTAAVGLAAETAAVGEPPETGAVGEPPETVPGVATATVAAATVAVGGTDVAVGSSSSSPQAVSATSRRALHQASWRTRRIPNRRGITSPPSRLPDPATRTESARLRGVSVPQTLSSLLGGILRATGAGRKPDQDPLLDAR